MFITYKITCNITGKYYIGSHKTDNIDDGYMGSGRFIRQSIMQYGVENHTKEILGVFDTREESLELEHRLVKEKRQLEREQCLNASSGGFSFDYVNATGKNVYDRTPEQWERQLSLLKSAREKQALMESTIPGYKDKRLAKISATKKEYYKTHPGSFYGKKHSEESKQKMRDSAKDIHAGKNNSQYGTFWVTNGYTNMKWSARRGDIPTGYRRGRVM